MLHPAEHRVRSETGRDIRGHQGLDIAGVGGEPIVAAGTEIAIVKNLPAAATHLHQRPSDRFQMDVAADGSDLNVAVANIGQRDWSAHRPDVYMTVSTLRTLTAASVPSRVKSPCKRSADSGPVEEWRLRVASGGISSS